MLTRLRNFSRLSSAEKALALRAVGWLALTRAGLRVLPFNRLHGWVAGRPRERADADAAWPRAVRRAMLRASRSLPGSSCLAQSLVAERLLHRGGSRARLSIGVARADAGSASTPNASRVALDAHAWVESGGLLVSGDDPHDRYRLLATFGTE